MTGIQLLEKLEKVSIADLATSAVEQTAEELADLNAAQMATGRDKKGRKLDEYSPFTIRYKKQFGKGLGAITDRRTLYMTGEHYKQLYAKVMKDGVIEYGSTVTYSDKIQEREGEDIYGLGPDFREEYAPITLAVFQRMMTEQTGLQFK